MTHDLFLDTYLNRSAQFSFQNLLKDFFLLDSMQKLLAHFSLKEMNKELFITSFIHSSFAHEMMGKLEHNERLEFLGDSVLQLMISDALFKKFPKATEGELSKLRSFLVNEESLAEIAHELDFSSLILVGKGPYKQEAHKRDSLLSNCFEAFLGSIFLSYGLSQTSEIFNAIIEYYEEKTQTSFIPSELKKINDPKSELQELIMKREKINPEYRAIELADHTFEITLYVGDSQLGSLKHSSKKKGMKELAKKILKEYPCY